MIAYFLSKLLTIFYGMLYPAYCSYKAVKTKDVKEYVHWMMYWIVFSIYNVVEVFADTLVGIWFPFYYEFKILFMLWLLSPFSRGGSVIYRGYVHPFFTRHEQEIDAYIAEFKTRTSSLIFQWGSRAFAYLTETVTGAILRCGGGDFRFLKVTKSFSYEDFDQPDMNLNRRGYAALDPGTRSDSEQDIFESSIDERQLPKIRHHRYAQNANRYSSVEDELGRLGAMSKPFSMMDLSEESQQSSKARGGRKKKEDNTYGTLPRTKRTTRKPLPK